MIFEIGVSPHEKSNNEESKCNNKYGSIVHFKAKGMATVFVLAIKARVDPFNGELDVMFYQMLTAERTSTI